MGMDHARMVFGDGERVNIDLTCATHFTLAIKTSTPFVTLDSGLYANANFKNLSMWSRNFVQDLFRQIPDKLIDLLSSKAVRGTVGIIYLKYFFEFTSGHLVLGSTESELNFEFQLENGWARFLTAIELVWTWFRLFFILSFSHVLLFMDYKPETAWIWNRKCNWT